MQQLTVVDHPLVQHKLSLMRRKDTPTSKFRQLLREISMLLGYELTRDLELAREDIETPLMPMQAPVLQGKKVVLISILRAGNGACSASERGARFRYAVPDGPAPAQRGVKRSNMPL